MEKITIKPHHFMDIIKLYGSGLEVFVPDEKIGHDFYKLDINKLSNITLNYGDEEDIFIIDSATFEVYYLNGIEYQDVIYYTD